MDHEIEIITDPTLTLVHAPRFYVQPKGRQVPAPERTQRPTEAHALKIGTTAAKGCYDSFGRDGRACEANQRTILEHKHGSVLEHINVGFYIEGITRALGYELNRHRHLAISQRSTRYTDEETGRIVLEPYLAGLYRRSDGWADGRLKPGDLSEREWQVLNAHLRGALRDFERYAGQVDDLMELNPNGLEGRDLRKWARGKARNSLPHNLETQGTWSTNLRSWRWVLEARGSRHAADEIRRLANILHSQLVDLFPLYFEDFECRDVGDGIPELVPGHSKV